MDKFEDENELLTGLKESDPVVIKEIYRLNFNVVRAYIIKNSGSFEDAKDIFQEALVVLFENTQSSSFLLTCSLKTYLYSVSRRLWLKKLRDEKRRQFSEREVVSHIAMVEEDLEYYEKRNQNFRQLESALNQIGEPCKSILESFYFDKKQMDEIASSFGYTNADNAKNQKYKCLKRLKKIFFSISQKGGYHE